MYTVRFSSFVDKILKKSCLAVSKSLLLSIIKTKTLYLSILAQSMVAAIRGEK